MEQKLWNKDVRESEKKERVILAGVCTGDEAESIESMDELEALLQNPKIMGLKHTSYDLFQLQMLIQTLPQ